jgi:hypothetical protein
MEVVRLVASSDAADSSLRQAAAVHFKNLIKKGWDESKDVSVQNSPIQFPASMII